MSELPAWLDAEGLPKSWRHFVYGLEYIRRMRSRDTLRMSDAGRMNQAEANDYRDWRRIHAHAARY